MLFKIPSPGQDTGPIPVSLRCPACRQQGTFHAIPGVADIAHSNHRFGQRRCPNLSCQTHVFVVHQDGKLVVSYPAERIDFDSSQIPAPVVESLEEAITCHATRSFTASAIMVRKTLEELCRDRGATGANLKERLKSLSTRVVLPQDLLDAMDDLRLLGNDAAHIESQVYAKVGQEEVEVGVMLAKEVLKAVYQYSTLVGKLRALKK